MNKQIIFIIFGILGVFLVGFALLFIFDKEPISYKSIIIGAKHETVSQEVKDGLDNSEKIKVSNHVVETVATIGSSVDKKNLGENMSKEIIITDGERHTVPLSEIISGGPVRDGIPSIDNPKFVNVSEASEYMQDDEPGISFSLGGVDRFYPFQILVWHEIVNDTFDGKRVLITYCPLCFSGIVFDPVVQGESVEFGTSGKLWNSNLVMYDRKTESLWSQVLGQSIVGEEAGNDLEVLPSDQIRFGNWKKLHPDGEVLSRKTGALRQYDDDPYGDYYSSPGVFFPLNNNDDRLNQKDFVLGIVVGGKAKAYLPEAIKKVGEIEDIFAGKTFIVRYESDIEAVRIFEKTSSGALERVNPFANFWFAWVAAHPDTELYK